MEKKESFIQAIQQNEALIYKVASFYTDCKNDRDDLVQEIIYNLWKSFETFKENAALSTWMYRVAMNVSIFYLKKSKKKVTSIPMGAGVLNIADVATPDFEERYQTLQKHIKDLNLFDKGILLLYLDDKSHEEIADIVGISKTNVGTRLSRIKEKLKKEIQNK